MVLFLVIPVYVITRRPFQIILVLLLIFYAYAYNRWEVALFLSGLLLADMSQARQLRFEDRREASQQPIYLGARPPRKAIWRVVLANFVQVLLLIFALYTCSAPSFCLKYAPGYRVLFRLIPQFDIEYYRFYPSFGAFLTLFLVSYNSPDWFFNRYILNSSVAQYLGRISFSAYLVHGPLLHIVGYRLFTWAWSYTGRDGLLAYCTGFCIAYGIFFALVVWIADIFWRVVDERFARFARSLEQFIMISIAETTSR